MQPFRLDGHLVEPSLNRIDGAQIEPKVMQVLVTLAARAGEVVPREELMAAVWADVFVTDDVLNRAIREIRRVFGDDADDPRVVETIRKRGYRVIAPVAPASSGTEEPPTTRDTSTWSPGPLALATMLTVALATGAVLVWLGAGRGGSLSTEAHMRFVPLTTDPGNEVDPALSPDGSRLAYVARAADGQPRIFVKPSAGGAPAQLTRGDGHDTAPAWSADGTHLAYAHLTGDSCVIRIVDSGGQSARDLVPCGSRDSLKMSWSADGAWLAIAARDTAPAFPSRIELVDVRSGARRRITEPAARTVGDDSPAFSPDGRSIAFVRSISGGIGDVYVVDVSGGSERRITTDNADVIGVDWEPDGRHLVFSSDRGGGINLFRTAIDGGEPVLITGGGAKVKHPSVARSGAMAFENWHYDINLVDVSIAGQARRPISPTTDQWNFHPQVSPDGTRIAFQSTRSGPYEIWVGDRDGSHVAAVTSSSGYKSMPRWSPDGRTLVFVSRATGFSELTIVDVATRRARAILSDPGAIAAPSFAHDGSDIYFGSGRGGSWQVWRVSIAGGSPRPVTTSGAYAALESLDGRWLYFSRLDRSGLWRQPIQGGPEQLVSADVAPQDWPNWGVFDRGVFFLTRPDDDDPLLMIAEEGRTPKALMRLVDHAWSGVAMSRDGAHALYAHADHRDANIVGIQFVR